MKKKFEYRILFKDTFIFLGLDLDDSLIILYLVFLGINNRKISTKKEQINQTKNSVITWNFFGQKLKTAFLYLSIFFFYKMFPTQFLSFPAGFIMNQSYIKVTGCISVCNEGSRWLLNLYVSPYLPVGRWIKLICVQNFDK